MMLMILEKLPFWKAGEESFIGLLQDAAHWEFEVFLILLFDVLLGAIMWPVVKRHIHRDVGQAEGHEHELIAALTARVEALEGANQ